MTAGCGESSRESGLRPAVWRSPNTSPCSPADRRAPGPDVPWDEGTGAPNRTASRSRLRGHDCLARSSAWRPPARGGARIHHPRDPGARAGHRRHEHDLQPARRRAAAATALSRSGRPGDAAEAALQTTHTTASRRSISWIGASRIARSRRWRPCPGAFKTLSTRDGIPERIPGQAVTTAFFDVLGVRPSQAGRS